MHTLTRILPQTWRHKRIHKCHSQLAISLRTGGTLPPHHFRVLFITVWQHVSSSPRHYATLHWYSPTVQQPGTQHSHAKNMTLGKNSPAFTCLRTHPRAHTETVTYMHMCLQTHQCYPLYNAFSTHPHNSTEVHHPYAAGQMHFHSFMSTSDWIVFVFTT